MRLITILGAFLLVSASCSHFSNATLDYGEDDFVAEPEFQWPVHGAVVSQKFRAKKGRYPRRHQGIDLAAQRNTPIYSIAHGRVIYAGHGFTGYGRLVIVEHISGHQSYYAHLNRYKVQRGDVVQRGELVGLMGDSGRATGVHLHFEVRKDNIVLNPLDLLPQATVVKQTASP